MHRFPRAFGAPSALDATSALASTAASGADGKLTPTRIRHEPPGQIGPPDGIERT